MSPVMQDSVETEHIFHSHNLKLRTNSFVTFSPYHNSNSHFLSVPQTLETLLSSGTWIAGGNRLLIHIRFSLDDIVLSDLAIVDIIEKLGLILSNAEVPIFACVYVV